MDNMDNHLIMLVDKFRTIHHHLQIHIIKKIIINILNILNILRLQLLLLHLCNPSLWVIMEEIIIILEQMINSIQDQNIVIYVCIREEFIVIIKYFTYLFIYIFV